MGKRVREGEKRELGDGGTRRGKWGKGGGGKKRGEKEERGAGGEKGGGGYSSIRGEEGW